MCVGMMIAGCFSKPVAWVAVAALLAFSTFAAFALRSTRHGGPSRRDRVILTHTMIVGLILTFLAVWNATTGHCLGASPHSR